jgi:hypothetical protein
MIKKMKTIVNDFFHSLREFVTCERKVCIISDRFSENKEVVHRVFSSNDGHAHRWCLRHIKANLKKAGLLIKWYWTSSTRLVVQVRL